MNRIRNFAQQELWAILSLATYDLWLLAFPLQGYFLIKTNSPFDFPWFVAPHTAGLFLTAWLGHRINFNRISLLAGIAVTFLTGIYPFFPSLENFLLTLIGISSAFLIVRIGCLLGNSQNPAIASALGLAIGNVFLGIILLINPPMKILFPLMGLLLLSQIPAPFPTQKQEPIGDLFQYLPFIFIFYLLIGTFYVCLMPYYVKYYYLNGSELLLYIGAVLISAFLFNKRPDYSLIVGVGIGIFATVFLHNFNRLTSNLAMYAVQAAAGFMDVFCFGLFIKGKDVVRRFGIGAGFMLLGPTVGLPLLYSPKWQVVMNSVGNAILGLGVLLLYFSHLRKEPASNIQHQVENEQSVEDRLAQACIRSGNPPDLFSFREWEILKLTFSGKNIKEISTQLEISESSVKTYLQRIYRKMKVSSKRELIQKLKSPTENSANHKDQI